jgi:hypothetical protein
MSFRKKILSNKHLQAELYAREYCIGISESNDPNLCIFTRNIGNDLTASLLFMKKGMKACSVTILIGSNAVSNNFDLLDLFLDDMRQQKGKTHNVLAVNLLWLRWNNYPEFAKEYKDDYLFDSNFGVKRIAEDLDVVAEEFIKSVSSPIALADQLVNLNSYSRRVVWGGGPVSIDPYVFAAILYFSSGEYLRAFAALEEGENRYRSPEPQFDWQKIRLRDFRIRQKRLVTHIGKLMKNHG